MTNKIEELILIKTKRYYDIDTGREFDVDVIICYDSAVGFYEEDYAHLVSDMCDDVEVDKFLSTKTYRKEISIWQSMAYSVPAVKSFKYCYDQNNKRIAYSEPFTIHGCHNCEEGGGNVIRSVSDFYTDTDRRIDCKSMLLNYPIENEVQDYISKGFTLLLQKDSE
jgi:hypothetical protein